jgi:biopolymer transport protein ExbB/TolQ
MGIFGLPMILIAIAIAVLTIKKVVDLFVKKDLPSHKLQSGLHAILFWGAVCAVFGILGQVTGTYNALGVIMKAREISPNMVAQGFAESLTTTIFGLGVLLVSAIIWFILFGRYRKLIAS